MQEQLQEQIRRTAPVLRMLLKDANGYPIVRFTERADADVTAAMPFDADDAAIIESLRAALGKQTAGVWSVRIDTLGCFAVIRPKIDTGRRAAGKIAVVTGAAQGFGLEIARDLAAEGAFVVLADINETLAQEEAHALSEYYGADRVMAVGMNVTDSGSIRQAMDAVIAHYGGLDVFIANAGVLKAESVKTQPESDFEFVCDVNYKGYFLCVQVVSKILALQHKADPAYTSDIIQINSKSGLVGSNRNGAYAGSKFGGIGLTQSFALELIEDGVKVNSICPGNFFDGPLWSNPDTGLFVQYLRTGKIPGAKTIDDVKKAYEAKVPMGRGCATVDVMKAIYYLIEQQYETGQALPVTGGQVMLH